ncbi:hypothetical protein OK348_10055 [Flavobacterium sp. MXW15]|uniref:DUF2059 domain-containing protein n=1 Tax=Xanthomonas chitinilytica TaxID=2989819 RepID=A0ABT3JW35_9XANT|nr:hypothetical protein [Xanthomonas sp. H13-6]MCW4455143.1 hypothetical protein [Flavobacterium sp. MXW15]MCW4472691.1 hypothetical protein [Xanthomonas sp. H13-6]
MKAARAFAAAALLATGAACAAPASEAGVGALMERLGLDLASVEAANDIAASVPEFAGLDDARRQCVQAPLQKLMVQYGRQIFMHGLGDNGAEHVEQWNAFLQTPIGVRMAEVTRAGMQQGAILGVPPDMTPQEREQVDAFARSEAFASLASGFDQVLPMAPESVELLVAELEQQCGVSVSPEIFS